MKLLTDAELQVALAATPDLIQGMDPNDWTKDSSPIQPCSVDLHIGQVFLPGEEDKAVPGAPKAKTDLSLKTGETAVVVTKETLHFPSSLAGIGFPPSHVSAKGLLMTNPGHVDPGYAGKLRFTVINMSAQSFQLRRGDVIVTLLLFELPNVVHADWHARTGLPQLPDPSWDDVNRLAKDFVKVEERAKEIATGVALKWTTWTGVGVVLVTFFGSLLAQYLSGVYELRAKVTGLEERINEIRLDQRVGDIEKKLDTGKKADKK